MLRPWVPLFALTITACSRPPSAPAPDVARGGATDVPLVRTDRVHAFYVGHSLQSDVPDMLTTFAASSTLTFAFKEQFIPGASLLIQWGERERQKQQFEPLFQGRYWEELAKGTYDVLVLIDSVPRGPDQMEETHTHAVSFARLALAQNPATRIYLYEPWHCTTTGTPQGCMYDELSPTRHLTWVERVRADAPMWDVAAARLRAELGQPVRLIPGARVLAALADQIRAGAVPGFTDYNQLFDDGIHLNPYGKYAIACAHYAALFGRSPEGLPVEVLDRWNKSYWSTPNWQNKQWPAPSADAARVMQRVAWEVVTAVHPAPQ